MARGRPAKTSHLNVLHGNPGKRKPKKQTFTASPIRFGIPHGLNKEVREKVRQVARYLQFAGVPIEFLRPVFERYCKHLQVAHSAYVELKKGVLLSGKKHPAAQIWKDNSESARKIEEYFERVLKNTKPPDKEEDPLKKYLNGR